MERYDRQRRVQSGIPLDETWAKASLLLVGIGGVGSPLAQILHRSGIGELTLVDGDRIHTTDLHRQVLYSEQDVKDGTPKVVSAAKNLEQLGGRTHLRTYEGMLTPRNALELFEGHDFVIDATDHIAVRSLIQKTSLQTGIGWFHSAAIADRWVAADFNPPGSPCYHCWVSPEMDQYPLGTCETEGVLPATCFAAAAAVMRLLTTRLLNDAQSDPKTEAAPSTLRKYLRGSLTAGERWVELEADPNCPTCSDQGLLKIQPQDSKSQWVVRRLCGSGTLEVWIQESLDDLEEKLRNSGMNQCIHRKPWSLRIEEPSGAITCYRDGRALITGKLADDAELATERLAQILKL